MTDGSRVGRAGLAVLQAAVTVAGLIGIVLLFGSGSLTAALSAVTVPSVLAALVVGTLVTAVQAQRWRLVARGVGTEIRFGSALARCWQAGFLNAVLPGGLLGDLHRVAEQRALTVRHRPAEPHRRASARRWTWTRGWGTSALPVWAERAAGTTIVLAAASVVLIPRDAALAGGLGAAALIVGILTAWAMRSLPLRPQLAVWGLAAANWALFMTLFVVAATTVLAARPDSRSADTVAALDPQALLIIAAVSIAAMSVPVSVGGWGLRETAAALTAGMLGLDADLGVTMAAGYGVLATVSVLPGAVVLVVRFVTSARARRQVELDADVRAHHDVPGGRAQRL